MPELISKPGRVAAAGEPPKLVDEYAGRASTGESRLSIAHMRSPWVRYSTPGAGGAEYISVCVPAFDLGTVHRD